MRRTWTVTESSGSPKSDGMPGEIRTRPPSRVVLSTLCFRHLAWQKLERGASKQLYLAKTAYLRPGVGEPGLIAQCGCGAAGSKLVRLLTS